MNSLSRYRAARERMVEQQLRGRGIRDPRVLAAMQSVPRERFVPPAAALQAYADIALPINHGQTISQPYIVALMTEALQLSGCEKVLEIGTGSGYQAAVLAQLVRHVVSIERHGEMLGPVRQTFDELGYENIELVAGDGAQGWPTAAPYDRIIVTAQASELPPALTAELAEGGVMVIPLGPPSTQTLTALAKHNGQLTSRPLCQCRFVPLVS